MKKGLLVIATVLVGSSCIYAQNAESTWPVNLGFKVGVPVTNMFSASNTSEFNQTIPGSTFSAAVPRYEFGVSGEFKLPKNLRFEIDGIYKRGGFDGVLPYGGGALSYNPTTFNWWEVPGLFKFNMSESHWRPFFDVGASLRHISTIDQDTYAPGLLGGFTNDNNSVALHNRNSYGGVAGIGFTFKKGPFELSPEARYTRWANEAFEINGLKTNLNQGDILLGITF